MIEEYTMKLFGLFLRIWFSPKVTGIAAFGLLLIGVAVCLAGCEPVKGSGLDRTMNEPDVTLQHDFLYAEGPYGMQRYVDHEAGVVCWEGTGLFCMPLHETTLFEKVEP